MSADREARRSTAGTAGGRALRCEEARILLMGFIDGELQPHEVSRLEDHLAVCVQCRREEAAFRKLGEVTEEMANEQIPGLDVDAAWDTIYRRLERSIGWILLSVGSVLLIAFWAWHLLHDFFLDGGAPLMVRAGVGAVLAGVIVLLVSIGREALGRFRSERYREVQR